MFPGPVFEHELRAVARKPRFYTIRFLCGLFFLYFVIVTAQRWRDSSQNLRLDELSSIGYSLFSTTILLQGFTAILLTPAIVAGTIAEDRERKILHFLLASPLKNYEVVLGKLLVRLLYLFILILVGFPILSLSLLFGGVDPVMLALQEAGIFSVVFFLASLSIFLSSRFARPRTAIVVAYCCVFAWLMLPILRRVIEVELVLLWPKVFGYLETAIAFLVQATPSDTLFAHLTPFRSPDRPESWYWLIGLNVLFGLAFLIPTIRGLRRVEQDDGQGKKTLLFDSRNLGRAWVRNRPFSLDRPMLWKECLGRFRFRGRWVGFLITTLKLLVIANLAVWLMSYAWPAFQESMEFGYISATDNGNRHRYDFTFGIRFATVVGYSLLIFLLAAISASSITSEKEKDSWISLISTSLEGGEILRGKAAGAFWSARYLYAGLLILWTTGAIAGSLHPSGFALLVICTTVYSAFAVSLGIHYSSICRTSTRALVSTFTTLIILNGGYMFCCLPIFRQMAEPSPAGQAMAILSTSAMSVLVEGFVACSYWEVADFLRSISSPNPYEHPVAMIFAYILSISGYALAGFGLFSYRVMSFDDDVDRPRRPFPGNWSHARTHLAPDPSGIMFLDPEDEGAGLEEPGSLGDATR